MEEETTTTLELLNKVHQFLLASLVLSGVFTDEELERFLADHKGKKMPKDYKQILTDIREWKSKQ